jgi:hypothetical protein
MLDNFSFSKAKKIFYAALIVFSVGAVLLNFSFLRTRADTSLPFFYSAAPQLMDRSSYQAGDESSAIVHSRFNNGSTNIIFYIDYGDGYPQYVAETVGQGDQPLTNYYSPAPGVGKYKVVEYYNDGGSFGCSGLSFSDCVANPRLISQFSFEITADDASSTTATSTLSLISTSTPDFVSTSTDPEASSTPESTDTSTPSDISSSTPDLVSTSTDPEASSTPDLISTSTPSDISSSTPEASSTPDLLSTSSPSDISTSTPISAPVTPNPDSASSSAPGSSPESLLDSIIDTVNHILSLL